jgi:ubiquitin C-terminal hydrolase
MNYKGFANIGNTCYLNSGLQLIINNIDLCNLIIKNYNENKSELINELYHFIINYYNNDNNNILTPNNIKKIIEKKNNIFIGFSQQDSSEFILSLLDMINDEIKLNEIYEITTNIKIKCKLRSCLNISEHNENNNCLLLDIKTDCKDLNDCYLNYKTREKLEDENMYLCEKCNDKRIASKRLEIVKWPKHLIIILKRFEQTSKQRFIKNNQEISIPLEWKNNYKLKGIVYHSGSLHGGHYVYIGKINNKWILFNDSQTKEISENELLNYKNNGYIYYFEK